MGSSLPLGENDAKKRGTEREIKKEAVVAFVDFFFFLEVNENTKSFQHVRFSSLASDLWWEVTQPRSHENLKMAEGT